ncbi:MAG: succinate dehydrogenase/fumarate reductase cytochrome b subunit [Prevotella sp.]|nr:succinate dehydrogenase/fumarate reductase cytochrome b subunit [Candidatus Prevotella equi]
MWLFNSSIGRKVIMSVTGICLILFLTFHMSMNVAALFSADAYNMICEMLGANWYAVVATMGLAALAVVHIIYAFILTAQNKAARGSERYAVSEKPSKVEWASQNMLALGVIVLGGLLIHLANFWAKMMLVDLGVDAFGDEVHSTDGAYWIQYTFSQPVFVVLYVIWIAALWFHLTHGFWSAMQTVGLNGKTWFCRMKVISIAYATLICFGFIAVVLCFFGRSLCC